MSYVGNWENFESWIRDKDIPRWKKKHEGKILNVYYVFFILYFINAGMLFINFVSS